MRVLVMFNSQGESRPPPLFVIQEFKGKVDFSFPSEWPIKYQECALDCVCCKTSAGVNDRRSLMISHGKSEFLYNAPETERGRER